MASSFGHFVWYDLMATEGDGTAAFYPAALGWGAADAGLPDRRYTIFSAGPVPVGGLLEIPVTDRRSTAGPGWLGYVAVDDVDGLTARATAAGGAMHLAPADIPGIGRFAILADPQGAVFAVFKPLERGAPPPVPPGTPGHVGWNELGCGDWPAGFAFYAGLFGWTKGDTIDMGPMGTYQLFAVDGVAVGGMMNRPGPPAWLYYVNVAALGAAVDDVQAAGGRLMSGPHQVPGGTWVAQCTDALGVWFGMSSQAA